jgi:hypothetical protein
MVADFAAVGMVPAAEPFTRMNCFECGAPYGRMAPHLGTSLHIKNVGWV